MIRLLITIVFFLTCVTTNADIVQITFANHVEDTPEQDKRWQEFVSSLEIALANNGHTAIRYVKKNAKQLAVQFIRLEKNSNIITSATYVLVDENGIIVLMGLVPQRYGTKWDSDWMARKIIQEVGLSK